MKKLPSATRNLETEISARLAYVEIIRSLQMKNEKLEKFEQCDKLDTTTAAMIQQYQALVQEERQVTRRLEDRVKKMQLLRTRLQSLTTQRSEEERRHRETILMFSECSSPSPRFSPPPPAASSLAQPYRGVSFSSLLSLSGHLPEYCSGGQGSRLVEERIRHGSSQERDLLWSELGLPGSLISILLTGNNNLIKVVLVLAQVDQEKGEAIKREVSKSKKNVEKINASFLENIEELV